MPPLLETVTGLLASRSVRSRLGGLAGGDADEVERAAAVGVPAIIRGLDDKASGDGPESVLTMLDSLRSSVDDVSRFLDRKDPGPGEGLLDQLFGSSRSRLVSGLASEAEVGEPMMGRLLPLLAPIVLGALDHQRRDDDLDADGMAAMLASERAELDVDERSGSVVGRGSGGAAVGAGAAGASASAGAAVGTMTRDMTGERPARATTGGDATPLAVGGGSRRGGLSPLLWAVGAIALVLSLAWLLSRCNGDGDDAAAPTSSSVVPIADEGAEAADAADPPVDPVAEGGSNRAEAADAGDAGDPPVDVQAAVDAALAGIGVEGRADEDVVTLTGTVSTEADRLAAVDAVTAIPGVTAVADQIVVESGSDPGQPSDSASPPDSGSTGDAGPGDTINELLDLDPVTFAVLSDQLTPEGRAVLDTAAAFLLANEDIRIEIGGHTDADGDGGQNLILSQRRADAVRAYLVAQGVDGSRMVARGYGESRPKVSNDSEAGKAENRRIEFTIV